MSNYSLYLYISFVFVFALFGGCDVDNKGLKIQILMSKVSDLESKNKKLDARVQVLEDAAAAAKRKESLDQIDKSFDRLIDKLEKR